MRGLAVLPIVAATAAAGSVAWVFFGTSGRGPPPSPADGVRSDPGPVALYVSLPRVVAVRWKEGPVVPQAPRAPFPIGPKDTLMTAFVEIAADAWPDLDKALGGQLESRTERIDQAWASVMLTPGTLSHLRRDGDALVADEQRYDIRSIRRGTREGDFAWRIGDGLLMRFYTR